MSPGDAVHGAWPGNTTHSAIRRVDLNVVRLTAAWLVVCIITPLSVRHCSVTTDAVSCGSASSCHRYALQSSVALHTAISSTSFAKCRPSTRTGEDVCGPVFFELFSCGIKFSGGQFHPVLVRLSLAAAVVSTPPFLFPLAGRQGATPLPLPQRNHAS